MQVLFEVLGSLKNGVRVTQPGRLSFLKELAVVDLSIIDLGDLLVIEPNDPFAVLPQATFKFAVFRHSIGA